MFASYRNTAIFMVVIIIGVQWGFYTSYTSHFPTFKHATPTIHVHGMLMMCWMLLLVVQPMLIHTGKANLHRAIGRVSWVLGPAIIVSLYLIGKHGYWRGVGSIPEHQNLTFTALDSRGLFSFALFWALAMINRKNPAVHMRYMIATGLLAIGPGIGRGLATLGVPFETALTFTDITDLVIVGGLLLLDMERNKPYKPFLVVLMVLLFGALLWQIRDTEILQRFAGWYTRNFY